MDEAAGADMCVELPCRVESVRLARRLARRALSAYPWWRDDAVLIVSELVTNAILHGTPDAGGEDDLWLAVRIAVGPAECRVEVTDPKRETLLLPSAASVPCDAESGRGLEIVAKLSSAMGHSVGERSTVWAVLRRR